jgi:putative endonuclease
MSRDSRFERGVQGESIARLHLRRLGYRILASRWRCRLGEIDIIAEEKGTIVFVEVRTRTRLGHGLPQETVGGFKMRRIARVASAWLGRSGASPGAPCRFDVIAIGPAAQGGRRFEIVHLKDAFRDSG